TGPAMPMLKSLDECFQLPFVEGVSREFKRFFQVRWGTGSLPFSRSKEAELGGWVRFAEELEVDHCPLLALSHAWPPAVFPMYKGSPPSSSVTCTVECLQDEWPQDEWWQFHAQTEQAADA